MTDLTKPIANMTPHEELPFHLENIAALLGEEPSWADKFMQRIDTYTQAKEREARIDEEKVYRKSYPKRNTRANNLSRMTRGDSDRRIGELIALKDKPEAK